MRYYILTLLSLAINSALFTQTIHGTLLDEFGDEIIGANIYNSSNRIHAHSDENGGYELLSTNIGDTIQFSHVAYEPKSFVVKTLGQQSNIKLYRISIGLDQIVITNQVDALQLISAIDVQLNPVSSSQDVLRKVPGLFIGQHAGGGKAEQIFLRGFDIDHGTDIDLTVDGMPVNMVSHAHGQGYSDLHFLIPETIGKIEFDKGTYQADKGNFATAGYVGFKTKDKLNFSSLKLELGQFDSQRILGMFNLLKQENQSAYIATEYISSNGPFTSPQNFDRVNIIGKYQGFLNNKSEIISLTASHFSSSWDASGQIPTRAIESQMIERFGAIDDTEGGQTTRTNFLFNFDKFINESSSIKNTIYYSLYDFELFSNFTFFLEDPINGDQIKQKESRTIYGLRSEYNKILSLKNTETTFTAGISLRADNSQDNELSHTLNRQETIEQIQFGDISETNFGAFAEAKLYHKKWTINPGVRLDYFDFNYIDRLQALYSNASNNKTIISPKFNILYNQSKNLQFFLKTGKGFHSNDTRSAVTQNDRSVLPAAYGFDVGYIWQPASNMFLNMAFWFLYLEQEFVYVGDAGIVEASGKTRRRGLELNYRYQPIPTLFWNFDINYTIARAIEEEIGQNFIPLAPDLTAVTGLSLNLRSGLYSSANVRYIKDRPANEDNSIVAEGYTVVDFNVGYRWSHLECGFQIQNLLNTEWNETQFATESRLQNEPQSVEEIHFTPGTPFFARIMIQYKF